MTCPFAWISQLLSLSLYHIFRLGFLFWISSPCACSLLCITWLSKCSYLTALSSLPADECVPFIHVLSCVLLLKSFLLPLLLLPHLLIFISLTQPLTDLSGGMFEWSKVEANTHLNAVTDLTYVNYSYLLYSHSCIFKRLWLFIQWHLLLIQKKSFFSF